MGHKKDAALHGLSKKERKALEAREAELAAELERRATKKAKKAAKKKGKKSKTKTLAAIAIEAEREVSDAEAQVIADAKAERAAARKSAKTATADAAAKVLLDVGASVGATDAAKTAKAAAAEAGDDETDAQIKARVLAKRKRRAELEDEDYRASIDRDDDAAVRAYNEEVSSLGGGHFLTSTAELDKQAARLKGEPVELVAAEIAPDAEFAALKKAIKKTKAAAEAVAALPEIVETETEKGREFVVGEGLPVVPGGVDQLIEEEDLDELVGRPTPDEFAKPSEAPKVDFETNGNGQYKVKRPSDGKIVGYTRVTTYIANLEDRSKLEDWKMRLLLEGVAINDTEPHDRDVTGNDPVAAIMADLVHRRDVAIAKARKADRKGKLVTGELATYVDGAWKDFKTAVDKLAESMLTLGGVHEKAQKGTDLHALCELYDREGIDAVGDLLTEGKITPADLADVEAYADAIKRAGIKIVYELIEQTVANHELKVAGRLDRVVYVKFPGMTRATRCVGDIKTGRIDYGAGKIAQQLEMYAGATGYDLNTHEETDLKLSRTKAVVIHVPAGTGQAFIYPVDLTLGRKGNKLSGEVRAWRNEGKRAIDYATDLATPKAGE